MNKTTKIVLGIVALAVVIAGVAIYLKPTKLAGTTHFQKESFYEGLYAGTGREFEVNRSGAITFREAIETLTADDTLTVSESGKVIYAGTAGVDITLPTAASSAGVVYRVVVSANFASTNMTITGGAADSSDDLIHGVIEVAGADVNCASVDTVSFVNTAELIGDYVELRSNGTNWMVSGQGGTTGSITCTDAD